MRGQKLSGDRKRWHEQTSGDDDDSDLGADQIASSSFAFSPAGKFFNVFFGDTMRCFDYPLHKVALNWSEQPVMRECKIGNTVGEVIDDGEKFAVEIDVSHFRPDELSVDLNESERELLVEGKQENSSEDEGTTTRRFKRYFDVPEDIRIDALASKLTRNGKLKIWAPKRQSDEPVIIRRIPIRLVAESQQNDESDESTRCSVPVEQFHPIDSLQGTQMQTNPFELSIFCIEPDENG
ncbi:unnamed protein product [Toxocara canis]|nr:unnamed protein product [Toxocara canis]